METQLKSKGWYLSQQGIKTLEESCESKSPKVNDIIQLALQYDLHHIASKFLPDNICSGQVEKLTGPIVLQVQKIRNLAAPLANQMSRTAPRMLKLNLSDGFTHCVAIEFRPLSTIPDEIIPGTKVCLYGNPIEVNKGTILLKSDGEIKILGGFVEKLKSKWEAAKNAKLNIRTSKNKEDAPPLFKEFNALSYRARDYKKDGNSIGKTSSKKANFSEKSKPDEHLQGANKKENKPITSNKSMKNQNDDNKLNQTQNQDENKCNKKSEQSTKRNEDFVRGNQKEISRVSSSKGGKEQYDKSSRFSNDKNQDQGKRFSERPQSNRPKGSLKEQKSDSAGYNKRTNDKNYQSDLQKRPESDTSFRENFDRKTNKETDYQNKRNTSYQAKSDKGPDKDRPLYQEKSTRYNRKNDRQDDRHGDRRDDRRGDRWDDRRDDRRDDRWNERRDDRRDYRRGDRQDDRRDDRRNERRDNRRDDRQDDRRDYRRDDRQDDRRDYRRENRWDDRQDDRRDYRRENRWDDRQDDRRDYKRDDRRDENRSARHNNERDFNKRLTDGKKYDHEREEKFQLKDKRYDSPKDFGRNDKRGFDKYPNENVSRRYQSRDRNPRNEKHLGKDCVVESAFEPRQPIRLLEKTNESRDNSTSEQNSTQLEKQNVQRNESQNNELKSHQDLETVKPLGKRIEVQDLFTKQKINPNIPAPSNILPPSTPQVQPQLKPQVTPNQGVFNVTSLRNELTNQSIGIQQNVTQNPYSESSQQLKQQMDEQMLNQQYFQWLMQQRNNFPNYFVPPMQQQYAVNPNYMHYIPPNMHPTQQGAPPPSPYQNMNQ